MNPEQGGLGATLWQRPDIYFENSPVLRADRVTTPLLIMKTAQDSAVEPGQSDEWYHALSRLKKKAWMLTYSDGDHTIYDHRAQLDYTIRMGQFFDYFLKVSATAKVDDVRNRLETMDGYCRWIGA